jgi:hypothetical protein
LARDISSGEETSSMWIIFSGSEGPGLPGYGSHIPEEVAINITEQGCDKARYSTTALR